MGVRVPQGRGTPPVSWPHAALFLLAAGPLASRAAETDDAVERAEVVHEHHCAEVESDRSDLVAANVALVAAAWADVEQARSRLRAPVLSYWSGLLAQCLGRDRDAIANLRGFLVEAEGAPRLSAMAEEASRRLKVLGVELDEEAETTEPLARRAEALWQDHCRGPKLPSPNALEELSRTWGLLLEGDPSLPPPALAWLRARLALCIGQPEHAVDDLKVVVRAPAASPADRRRGQRAAQELGALRVFVDRRGDLLGSTAAALRAHARGPRLQIRMLGGVALGGVRTETRAYAGLDVGDDTAGVFGSWWDEADRSDVPAFSTYQRTAPTFGGAAVGTLQALLWAPRPGSARVPQFAVGAHASARVGRAVVDAWTLEAELACSDRDPVSEECSQASVRDTRLQGPQPLLDVPMPRLTAGLVLAWRFAPDSVVAPELQLVLPAADIATGERRSWCAASLADPVGRPQREWRDARFGEWQEDERAPGTSAFGASTFSAPVDPAQPCVAGGPTPVLITGRVAVSLEVRPKPWFAALLTVAGQPVLWSEPLGRPAAFPSDGLHLAAEAAVTDGLRSLPFLADLQLGVAFTP